MSRYYLTEAYGDLYNPRRTDETFYRNLKFVDYLQSEEIEEVMESLIWEFMDYGNTLDESYGLIEGVFCDDILEEVLCEAVPGLSIGSKKPMSAKVTMGRGTELAQSKSTQNTSPQSTRTQTRISRITGAAKKAKDAVKSAASGVGANTMSTLRRGKEVAAGAYERAKGVTGKAKAALTGLVRKGAFAVGSKMRQAGEKIEKSGKEAASAPAVTRSANIGGRRRTYVSEPTPETGRKRRAIGSTITRIADRLIKSGAERTPLPPSTRLTSASRVPYFLPLPSTPQTKQQATQATQQKPTATGRRASTPGEHLRAEADRVAKAARKRASTPGEHLRAEADNVAKAARRTASSPKPTASSPKPTARTRKIGRLAPPTPEQESKINEIKAGIAKREAAAAARKAAKKKPVAENYELLAQYILEDLINEGYADDLGSAMVILENLSDDVIEEMALQYLEY